MLLDNSEQALYRLCADLENCETGDRAVPVLGSVLDDALLRDVFGLFRPEIVFHAAAFKHLPLLESQPFAAIENNTIGSFQVAQAAAKFRSDRLIAVSTDKAVNPTSIMGASKRLAELIVTACHENRTRMTTVRLGNVLSSDGSVAPRFIEQIERGGPVTITDRAATRYFYTIDETVELVLKASAVDNALIIPEVTEPTSILALAQFLMQQLNADRSQVGIDYTGLSAGEKLTEELCSAEELRKAKHKDGYRVIANRMALDVEHAVAELRDAVRERDLDLLLQTVRRFVPEYQPSEKVLQMVSASTSRSQ